MDNNQAIAHSREVRAALLPWPDPILPIYQDHRYGRWIMTTTYGEMPGYYTSTVVGTNARCLRRIEHGKKIVWMSLTPMELESHMAHIAMATGTVLVFGLGMGMYVRNIACKPDVKRIIVVERDTSVFEMLKRSSDYADWPGVEKVEVVIGDARNFSTREHIDYLYADFWKQMAWSGMTKAMRRVYENNPNTACVGYWTQEFDFVDYLRAKHIPIEVASAEHYQAWAEGMNMPLLYRGSALYAQLSTIAVTLQACTSTTVSGDIMAAMAINEKLRSMYDKVLAMRKIL